MKRWTFLSAALVLAALPGCGSAPVDPALADVVFQGSVTPQALQTMLAMTPLGVEGKGAVVDMPANDAIIPAAKAATFSWHLEGTSDAVTPGSFLVFSTDTAPQLLRVFTSETSYTPDTKAWATLEAKMVWTKLHITSAGFDGDDVVPGSGPYESASMEFCIEP